MNIQHYGELKDVLEVNADLYKEKNPNLIWAVNDSKIQKINRTERINEFSIRVVFNIPISAEELLALPIFNMISPTTHKKQFNETIGTDKLVGTGPFIFTGVDFVGDEIEFLRNDDYWKEPSYLTRLVYQDIGYSPM